MSLGKEEVIAQPFSVKEWFLFDPEKAAFGRNGEMPIMHTVMICQRLCART